jgi:hypothetical protein
MLCQKLSLNCLQESLSVSYLPLPLSKDVSFVQNVLCWGFRSSESDRYMSITLCVKSVSQQGGSEKCDSPTTNIRFPAGSSSQCWPTHGSYKTWSYCGDISCAPFKCPTRSRGGWCRGNPSGHRVENTLIGQVAARFREGHHPAAQVLEPELREVASERLALRRCGSGRNAGTLHLESA